MFDKLDDILVRLEEILNELMSLLWPMTQQGFRN